jgi:hypothetical protein
MSLPTRRRRERLTGPLRTGAHDVPGRRRFGPGFDPIVPVQPLRATPPVRGMADNTQNRLDWGLMANDTRLGRERSRTP